MLWWFRWFSELSNSNDAIAETTVVYLMNALKK